MRMRRIQAEMNSGLRQVAAKAAPMTTGLLMAWRPPISGRAHRTARRIEPIIL
jgi:hypothetical protein